MVEAHGQSFPADSSARKCWKILEVYRNNGIIVMWGWKGRGGHSCEACDHLCETDFFSRPRVESSKAGALS